MLLCNYFLYCGWKAWVILGHAVPEGKCLITYHVTEVFVYVQKYQRSCTFQDTHTLYAGATAYVLTESPTGVGSWLWNPNTGKHYTQHEPYTPLTSVGCAINEENVSTVLLLCSQCCRIRLCCFQVWANIQDYDDPSQVSFDFSNGKHWRPLFPTTSQPLASVQQELHYSETDLTKVQELQDRYGLRVS